MRDVLRAALEARGWSSYEDEDGVEWWAPESEWPGADAPWPAGFGMSFSEAMEQQVYDDTRRERHAS